jgi:hypothetical protein
MNLRLYGWSVLIAVGLMVLVQAIVTIPGCENVGIVLLPGMLLAALVFPEGIHSDSGIAYLVLAVVLDGLLLAIPVMLCLKRVGRTRQRRREGI